MFEMTLLPDVWPHILTSPLSYPNASAPHKKSPKLEAGTKHGDEEEGEEEDTWYSGSTLHALSAATPVRHKVDLALHARSLRLAHATIGAARAQRSLARSSS